MSSARRVWAGCLVFGALLVSTPMCAEEPLPAGSSVSEPDFMKPDATPSFPVVRVILTLGLLMGGLYFVRPWLKKMKWAGAPLAGGKGLDVISRAYLGPRAGVCLVHTDGRRFLLGVGADGVRLLAELGPSSTSETEAARG